MLEVRPPLDWCCWDPPPPEGGRDLDPEGWVRVAWEKELRRWERRVGFSEVRKRSQTTCCGDQEKRRWERWMGYRKGVS